ncbi:MAG: GIDE domain-containing protein [Polyangiales bacterium]
MSDTTLYVLAAAGCLGVVVIPLVLYLNFNRNARTMRKLRGAHVTELAAIPESTEGRFSGVVAPFGAGTMNAPISGKPCVYFELVVQRVLQRGTGRAHDVLFEDRGGVPFIVRDDSGSAVVDPTNARVAVEATATTELRDADALEAYLVSKGYSTSWFLSSDVSYNERLIEVGETVHVIGAGTREPDPDSAPEGYRGAMPTRLRIADSPACRLVISDDPRARPAP